MGKNKVSADSLRAAGYKYKMESLTIKEKKEYEKGRPIMVNGQRQMAESRDFDYFYKKLPNGVEVQIFHAIKKFYYKGMQLRNMKQIPLVEDDAKNTAHYAALQKQVMDTKPTVYMPPPKRYGADGELVAQEGYIKCVGGPLNDNLYKYNNKLPFFMLQYDDKGITKAARYGRDKDLPNVYNFLNVIG